MVVRDAIAHCEPIIAAMYLAISLTELTRAFRDLFDRLITSSHVPIMELSWRKTLQNIVLI